MIDPEGSEPVPTNAPAPRYEKGDRVRIDWHGFNPPDVWTVVGIHNWTSGQWWYQLEGEYGGNPQTFNNPEEALEPADG